MAGRTVYRNLWYGVRLEHPVGWQVRQTPGCILISPDATLLTCAAVRFFAMDAGVRVGQVLGQAAGRAAQAQTDLVNAVRHLGQVRREGANRVVDGTKRRMDAFFREQEEHVMPTLRGDQILVNPVDGTRYEVPLTYGTYWSDAANRVYRTCTPGDPPAVGANRLEPI